MITDYLDLEWLLNVLSASNQQNSRQPTRSRRFAIEFDGDDNSTNNDDNDNNYRVAPYVRPASFAHHVATCRRGFSCPLYADYMILY